MKNYFEHLSSKFSDWTGSTIAFALALLVVLIWLGLGPHYHFSTTWLLAITIITDVAIFLMVFLMQNTQNRDSKAIQLKLNELIVADQKARDTFIGLESLTDSELAELDEEFKRLLNSLDVSPSMHKLHTHIKREKEHRSSLYDQAEHLVGTLLSPLSGKSEHKK